MKFAEAYHPESQRTPHCAAVPSSQRPRIALDATIVCGVTIGRYALIGAGAVTAVGAVALIAAKFQAIVSETHRVTQELHDVQATFRSPLTPTPLPFSFLTLTPDPSPVGRGENNCLRFFWKNQLLNC